MLGIIILLTIIGFLGVIVSAITRISFWQALLLSTPLVISIILTKWYETDHYIKHLFIATLWNDENYEKYAEDLSCDDVELYLLEEREDGTKKYRMITNKGTTFEGILSSNRNKLTDYVKR